MPERKNPYNENADELRGSFGDPTVNVFEHEVNWPRFKALLPQTATRILDFACGPGNFTSEYASLYPQATILGVDASAEILPHTFDDLDGRLRFLQWNGALPLEEDPFDLITIKMGLHSVPEQQLRPVTANLVRLLSPNGHLAFSVPHPYDSQEYNVAKSDDRKSYYQPGVFRRAIGNTGIEDTMTHRKFTDWINLFLYRLPNHSFVSDEPSDQFNNPKRLNILFMPRYEDSRPVLRRLESIPIGSAHEEQYLIDLSDPAGRAFMNSGVTPIPVKKRKF